MIGDGWDEQPSARPGEGESATPNAPRRVMVVTGSRADFGLLVPVIRAVTEHPGLEAQVVAAGSHLISPAETFRDVKKHFPITDSVPMQIAGRTTRLDDAEATGRGIARFTRTLAAHRPHWVVVLGDRIEAFAAASAASIAGIAVAHLHGGDRAEGIADEAMRHAISKLAHLHLPATPTSAERLVRMGELESTVHCVGSPAVDAIGAIDPMDDAAAAALGDPAVLLLMHPIGRHPEEEEHATAIALEAIRREIGGDSAILALDPNHDPGRQGVKRALDLAAEADPAAVVRRSHMPREQFVSLLKRLALRGGLIVGNSSAALIEAAVVGLPAVNIGPRQAGRETPNSVVTATAENTDAVRAAWRSAIALDRSTITHPYGDGTAGPRAASALASIDPTSAGLLRKHNCY